MDKKDKCQLSASLDRVFQSRDKVHAHNEAILTSERNLPSWADTGQLFDYAESFVKLIGRAYLGIADIIIEPRMTSRRLELLMAVLGLVTKDFAEDERNRWVVERLRREAVEKSRWKIK